MIFLISQGVLKKVEIESKDDLQVVLPSGITEIGSGAFAYSGVRSVVFSETLEKIGRKAFTNSKMQTVRIPDKVTQISMCRQSDWPWFIDCPQLKEIRFDDGTSIAI